MLQWFKHDIDDKSLIEKLENIDHNDLKIENVLAAASKLFGLAYINFDEVDKGSDYLPNLKFSENVLRQESKLYSLLVV